MSEELTNTNFFILAISLIFIISILGVQFSTRINAPSLIFFIGIGMVVGGDVFNLVQFRDPQIAQLIGMMALVVILFDGGIKTNWGTIRPMAMPAISLATLGVFLTSMILGLAAKFIFGLSWAESFLMGALVGSTDAAAVFAMLSGKNINDRLDATLEGESGANDPMAVFLTVTLISFVSGENAGILGLIGQFIWQMGGGLLIGLLIGWVGSKGLHRIHLASSGLYPLLAFSFAFLAYSTASLANASGLLAVYVTALVIGNTGLKQRNTILRFNEGFSWIAQIVMFLFLGLFVVPGDLFTWDIMVQGLLLSLILMFIARPVATFISVAGMKFNLKEKLFLSWAGLRGAVPIVLALFPMLAGLEHSQLYFNIIFFVVLSSTIFQGTTMALIADKLQVAKPTGLNPLHSLDFLSVGKQDIQLLEYKVDESTTVNGKKIKETGFPAKANIAIILRDGDTLAPHGNVELQKGDLIYILVPNDQIDELENVLRGSG
ncbi:potassium/proton antiporter [Virgibacillus sediminis]|uniref:Potassium/proton antiporter n=1 Tax=Virgibacillus sediminis TaxID=202260 RepID=A0ABV7A9U8_9BACI